MLSGGEFYRDSAAPLSSLSSNACILISSSESTFSGKRALIYDIVEGEEEGRLRNVH